MTPFSRTLGIFVLLSLLPLPSHARGAEECTLTAAVEQFSASLDQATTTAREAAEFEARRNLLATILSCAKEETENVKKNLEGLSELNEENAAFRDLFLSRLGAFEEFYKEKEEALQTAKTKKQVTDLAREVLLWREGSYLPTVQPMVEFLFILQERPALVTASDRLGKIRTALESIGIAGHRELRPLLEQAAVKVREAQDLNEGAYQLFLDTHRTAATTSSSTVTSLSASSTATSTPHTETSTPPLIATTSPQKISSSTTTPETASTTPESISSPEKTVLSLIEASLTKIKESYDLFFEMGKVIQGLLRV